MAEVCGHDALGLVPVGGSKLFVRLSARPEERMASEFAELGCAMEMGSAPSADATGVRL